MKVLSVTRKLIRAVVQKTDVKKISEADHRKELVLAKEYPNIFFLLFSSNASFPRQVLFIEIKCNFQ